MADEYGYSEEEEQPEPGMGERLERYRAEHLCCRCLHAMPCAVVAATSTQGMEAALVTVTSCGHFVPVEPAEPNS